MQIRCSAKQATEAYFAKEMVRRTVSAMTRKVDNVAVGDLIMFYRNYPNVKSQKAQALRGCFLGPALVIGHQGGNVWVSFAGRCYLVAPEHVRAMAPDECSSAKPLIRQGLENLRDASKATDYIDLSKQDVDDDQLHQAVEQPAGNDMSVDEPAVPIQQLAPEVQIEQEVQQHAPMDDALEANPQGVVRDEALEAIQPPPNGERVEEPGMPEVPPFPSASASEAEPPAPVTWKPQGASDSLRWQRKSTNRSEPYSPSRQGLLVLLQQRQTGVMSAKLQKKMLDKEVPFSQIREEDLPLYEIAEDKEWKDWLKNGSVKVIKGKDAVHVRLHTSPKHIINIRFVYRDKNASIRTPQVPLPIKAKARLCAQASKEPAAMAGLIKLDSPTVQRVGVMIFLQLLANFGWHENWIKADISSAFLQGVERDNVHGKLYLNPPNRPLQGVDPGDILEVIKSVYGLPDAPRAWWEEVTKFFRDLGFTHSRMDIAFLIYYHDDGSVGAMLVLHVDDMMIAHDGSKIMRSKVNQINSKYPFGEWLNVAEQPKGVTYTGRQIRLVDKNIQVCQQDYIDGRMEQLKVPKQKSRDATDLCSPQEKAEFRSGVGDLHWVSSQTRVDYAVDVSRLQKRQNNPTYGDLKNLSKTIREVKSTADLALTIQPISDPVVAVFSDSSLYGATGELIECDSDLEGYDKHSIHSQGGALITVMSRPDLEKTTDVPFSLLDWRTRASKRVFHSTFAAEGGAAAEAIGMGKYVRAYLCDIMFGHASWVDVGDFGEDQLPLTLLTDCKSLYDNLKKDGSVPDDKWAAIAIASLRGTVSAGPGRNSSKSECRWVASRWQLADCLTKCGLAKTIQERLRSTTTRLHELSAQNIKRNNSGPKKAHFVNLCFFSGFDMPAARSKRGRSPQRSATPPTRHKRTRALEAENTRGRSPVPKRGAIRFVGGPHDGEYARAPAESVQTDYVQHLAKKKKKQRSEEPDHWVYKNAPGSSRSIPRRVLPGEIDDPEDDRWEEENYYAGVDAPDTDWSNLDTDSELDDPTPCPEPEVRSRSMVNVLLERYDNPAEEEVADSEDHPVEEEFAYVNAEPRARLTRRVPTNRKVAATDPPGKLHTIMKKTMLTKTQPLEASESDEDPLTPRSQALEEHRRQQCILHTCERQEERQRKLRHYNAKTESYNWPKQGEPGCRKPDLELVQNAERAQLLEALEKVDEQMPQDGDWPLGDQADDLNPSWFRYERWKQLPNEQKLLPPGEEIEPYDWEAIRSELAYRRENKELTTMEWVVQEVRSGRMLPKEAVKHHLSKNESQWLVRRGSNRMHLMALQTINNRLILESSRLNAKLKKAYERDDLLRQMEDSSKDGEPGECSSGHVQVLELENTLAMYENIPNTLALEDELYHIEQMRAETKEKFVLHQNMYEAEWEDTTDAYHAAAGLWSEGKQNKESKKRRLAGLQNLRYQGQRANLNIEQNNAWARAHDDPALQQQILREAKAAQAHFETDICSDQAYVRPNLSKDELSSLRDPTLKPPWRMTEKKKPNKGKGKNKGKAKGKPKGKGKGSIKKKASTPKPARTTSERIDSALEVRQTSRKAVKSEDMSLSICKFWLTDTCNRGNKCRFKHPALKPSAKKKGAVSKKAAPSEKDLALSRRYARSSDSEADY